MTIDYHLHPGFSPDATGDIREFCRVALDRHIQELAFTTHCELDPVRQSIERVRVAGSSVPVTSGWVEGYLREIEEAGRTFPELRLRAGVEVGYEPAYEDRIARWLEQYRFDFVLGAVHCIDHVAICSGEELDRVKSDLLVRGRKYIFARYFENLTGAARCGLFDALAHIDVYRKYLLGLLGIGSRVSLESSMAASLEAVAGSQTGIEVNTSAFRRGAAEPYPERATLRVARQSGVATFTVGSDAHCPDDVGAGIPEAVQLLAEIGASPARFARRRRID